MMIYLDLQQSRREHPNENWARELMELFTVGIGNYTEQDIRESAPAPPGFKLRFTTPAISVCAIPTGPRTKEIHGPQRKSQRRRHYRYSGEQTGVRAIYWSQAVAI